MTNALGNRALLDSAEFVNAKTAVMNTLTNSRVLPSDIVCIILQHVCSVDVQWNWQPKVLDATKIHEANLKEEVMLSYDTVMVSRVNKEYHNLLTPTIKLSSNIASVRIEYILDYVLSVVHNTDHSLKRVSSLCEGHSLVHLSVYSFLAPSRWRHRRLLPNEYGPVLELYRGGLNLKGNAMYYGLQDAKQALFAQAKTHEEKEKMTNLIVKLFKYMDRFYVPRFHLPSLRQMLET